MSVPKPKPWFAPKRYGYGAGLPISWEGWVALLAYLGLVLGSVALLTRAWQLPLIGFVTALFIALCARRTQGGWRWRWGEK